MAERTITLNDDEAKMVLEALAGLFARSGDNEEMLAAMQLAQRVEGFTIDGRPGAKAVDHGQS